MINGRCVIFLIDKKKRFAYKSSIGAGIAQLVEQLICNHQVGSSSLSAGTIQRGGNVRFRSFCFLIRKKNEAAGFQFPLYVE